MISKKTAISTIIVLTALALVTMPSVLTFDSVYAQVLLQPGGFIDGKGQPHGGAIFGSQDNKKDSKSAEDKSSEPRKSSTDSNQPCKQDNNEKGTHFYCEGTHHHCKPGPDNPKCVKT
jgi:hypothetical protein